MNKNRVKKDQKKFQGQNLNHNVHSGKPEKNSFLDKLQKMIEETIDVKMRSYLADLQAR